MKKILITLLALVFAVSFTIAQNKETRSVDSFSKISFRIPGKLYLKQGAEQKVELEGSKEILSKIETKVSDGRLSIGRENDNWNWKWNEEDKIIAYVTVKSLEGLNVSGSGDVFGQSKFKTGDLSLAVSGSGSLHIEVEASDIEANVSGSGHAEVKGKCSNFESKVSGSGKVTASLIASGNADISISGSGKVIASGSAKSIEASVSGSGEVLAADLAVNSCDIRISGSGDVEVNVKESLEANISGSGSVSYRGNPSHVNSHSSGSGKVRKLD